MRPRHGRRSGLSANVQPQHRLPLIARLAQLHTGRDESRGRDGRGEQLGRFEEKPLRSVTQGGLDLSKIAATEETGEAPASVESLVTALKAALATDVADVRATDN